MQVKKQQVEPDLKQQTGSKLGKEYIGAEYCHPASLVAQTVKCLSTMRETWVQSLGWEDPQEEGMAIHSSSLA